MSKIEVKSLSVSFGSQQVLRDINLIIPDRQIVAIIGPSGCGKTTLLKSLNRILDLNEEVSVAGDIFVDGENIYAPGMDVTALRKKVGFCRSARIRCRCRSFKTLLSDHAFRPGHIPQWVGRKGR